MRGRHALLRGRAIPLLLRPWYEGVCCSLGVAGGLVESKKHKRRIRPVQRQVFWRPWDFGIVRCDVVADGVMDILCVSLVARFLNHENRF